MIDEKEKYGVDKDGFLNLEKIDNDICISIWGTSDVKIINKMIQEKKEALEKQKKIMMKKDAIYR